MRSVKAFLLSALAILIAILVAAAAVQAVETEWIVEGKAFSELKEEEGDLTLTSKPVSLLVPSLGVTVECKGAEGGGEILKAGGERFEVTLTGCAVAGSAVCKVAPFVVSVKTKMIEVGGSFYNEIASLTEGAPLAKVVITGEKCTLPKESTVKGTYAAQISQEEEEAPPLKFSQAITEAVNKALKAESKSTLSLTFGEKGAVAYFSGEFVPPLNIPQRRREVPYTRLCMDNVGVCMGASIYPTNTWIKAASETESSFRWGNAPAVIAKCAESEFEAKTTANRGAPLPATSPVMGWEYNNCENGCSVDPVGMPYTVEFVTTGGGNGEMFVKEPSFKIVCGGKTCVYGASGALFTVIGGSEGMEPVVPTKLKVGPYLLLKEPGSDAACAADAVWEAPVLGGEELYKVFNPNPFAEEPEPLFVTR